MNDQLRPESLSPLLYLAIDDPDVSVRLSALNAASHFSLDQDGWERVAQATWWVVQSEPAGSSARREALALAVRIPLRSVREQVRRLGEDPNEQDQDAIAAALDTVGDPSRIVPLLEKARTDPSKFYYLAAMPVEEAITLDQVPPLADGANTQSWYWRALVLARLAEYGPLDTFLLGNEELQLFYRDDPGFEYNKIARVRPIPERMRAHLLERLDRIDATFSYERKLTVWAATGIADAEGHSLLMDQERAASAAPVPTPSPDEINQAAALRARLPDALFGVDYHPSFDILKYLPEDGVPALILDAITWANRKALTFRDDDDEELVDLGNSVIDLISSLPATDRVPIADLVAEQLRAQSPALDDEQLGWVIAKCDAQHLIAELVNFIRPDHTVDERKRVLRLLGAAADCQSGRAGSPYRGAGPSGMNLPGELLDDVASDSRLVSLLFATTRQKENNEKVFSGERAGGIISFGSAIVRIPEDHRIGHVEQPSKLTLFGYTIYEERRDSMRHLVLRALRKMTEAEWIATVKCYTDHDCMIFIHGFNTSFRDSIFRFAQIVWDLQFGGLPVLFSWPSRGMIHDYLYDRDSATGAAPQLIEVLTKISCRSNVRRIHIVAHSMGNFCLLEALMHSLNELSELRLGEIILAAPDVDRDLYRQRVAAIRFKTSGMTLYASAADRALSLSKKIAGDVPRAGDVVDGMPVLVDGVDAIDVTFIGEEMFGLGHTTFASTRSVINDMKRVLKGERPPDERSADIEAVPDKNRPKFWRYRL